jgi:hypothetical protein
MSTKTKYVLLFNKKNGTLIGKIDPNLDLATIDKEKFCTKVVELGANEYYFGDYETGKIVSTDETPYISEKDIRFYTSADILGHYPYHKQLNIIIDMLEKSNIEKTPEFNQMIDILRPMRERANLQMESYKNSKAFAYYSEEHDKELVKKRYEF